MACRECPWQMASASASAASSGRGSLVRWRMLFVISITCFFSALLHKESEELDLLTGMVRSPQQVRQITQTHEKNIEKEAQG